MGSSLVNYYRKKDDKDEHVPKVVQLKASDSAQGTNTSAV